MNTNSSNAGKIREINKVTIGTCVQPIVSDIVLIHYRTQDKIMSDQYHLDITQEVKTHFKKILLNITLVNTSTKVFARLVMDILIQKTQDHQQSLIK